MSFDPLTTTFGVLAASSRPEADEVLIAALDGPRPELRGLAASAICHRGSVRGLIELLRRFDDLSDATRRRLAEPSEPLAKAFRQSLRHGDERLILQALTAARAGGHVEQLPNVVPLLKAESPTLRAAATDAAGALSDRLDDLLNHRGEAARAGRDALVRVRDEALDALAAACERFDALPEPIRVVEPLLALGTPTHPAVAKVLRHASADCRRFAADVLATSRHTRVMRLLFEFLGEPYPPRRVFETIQTRDDPEFVAALIRWLPARLTATQASNLRQVTTVPWLTEDRITDLPEPLQGRLPPLIVALGLPDARKTELQEWLVRNGSAEGRRGATQIFDRLDFETTRRILLDSLDSDDEDVSAWATSQLRSRHVPGAFKLLIDRLDNPSETVAKAARDQLRGFTVEHLVAIHDRLPPSLCRQAGQLVRKIDPDCFAKLAAMIGGPVQRQRIAAAQAVGRLGMGAELRHALLGLLKDEDNVIRRIGVEVLSEDRSPEVLDALQEMTSDPSPRVRQAAERALAGEPALELSAAE